MKNSLRTVQILTPWLIAGFYFFLLAYQASHVAITDDARFYMDAGKNYAHYILDGWQKGEYFKPSFIDRYWTVNHEHPPFAKLLMAGGYILFHKVWPLLSEVVSLRIGISFFAAITLVFIFSFVKRAFSFHAAVFASLFFIFLPRTFFHARVATLDFTVAGTCFIFVYCYYRGLSSRFWAWMTGIAFGCALATKLNAPFMVVPVVIHYCIIRYKNFRSSFFKTLFAPQFISMLLFSLPLFFILWPWLWHNSLSRFTEYVKFHVNHYGILMYYLGEIYSTPRPPWHAPLVMMGATTPLLTLFFAIMSWYFYPWKHGKEKGSPMLLVALSALISISTLMFLPAPFYSGVKLFQPFFPFLAIMSGVGLCLTLEKATLLPAKWRYAPFFLFFISPALDLIDLRNDHLSYYSEITGGTKGALTYHLEAQYYDLFYYDMTHYFNTHFTSYTPVSFEPNGGEYQYSSFILKNSRLLTRNFRYSDNRNTPYRVLTHEYRWSYYPELLRKYRNMKPVYILKRQGVPLVNIYSTPNSPQ